MFFVGRDEAGRHNLCSDCRIIDMALRSSSVPCH
jgi:hypothetical protein